MCSYCNFTPGPRLLCLDTRGVSEGGVRGRNGKKSSGLIFGALVYSSVPRLGAKEQCLRFTALRQLPVNGTH